MNQFLCSMLFITSFLGIAQFDNKQPAGYLFAHMVTEDYGGLYYSLSDDAMQWEAMNDGETILPDYHGHPDIVQGHDGDFYMIGVEEGSFKVPLWTSNELLKWKVERYLPKEIFDGTQTPGHQGNPSWYGAPKLFYDAAEEKYIITWHAPDKDIAREDAVNYWCSMRTFYVTTPDFKNFTLPKKLFEFDMGTIDVIIRKENGLYYAILKDECEPGDQWPTGKSIRVSVSHGLTGPYSYPGPPVSPNFHEAPTVVPRPSGEGWFMYYEMYTGERYSGSQAPSLAGPWYSLYQLKYEIPPNARHGCMLPLTQEQYQKIKSTFK